MNIRMIKANAELAIINAREAAGKIVAKVNETEGDQERLDALEEFRNALEEALEALTDVYGGN